MRSGRPLSDVLVLDCHAHIGRSFGHPADRLDAASMVEIMDRLGIDRACISGTLAIGSEVPAGNDEVLRALDDVPDRFIGAAVVNPHYPDEMASEIERLIKEALPDARVEIRDLAGDGDHYAANVVSSSFKGKSRVQQHQMIYAALKGRMGGELHALALQTSAPEE